MTSSPREHPPRRALCGRNRLVARGVVVAVVLAAWTASGEVSPVPDDGLATFSAHETHDGLVIDRMRGGEPAVFAPEGWFRWPGDPILVRRDASGQHAGLWLVETGSVIVRDGPTKDARLIGRVEPSWDDQAIRLSLEPVGGPPLKSDVFRRIDLDPGLSALSRNIDDSLQVLGTYQASLRDPDGKAVGWMRVDITNRGNALVSYRAALPAGIDERLAAAAAQALGSEVDYIENHVRGTWRAPERR
jgi:hypothetical protein